MEQIDAVTPIDLVDVGFVDESCQALAEFSVILRMGDFRAAHVTGVLLTWFRVHGCHHTATVASVLH